MDGIMVETGQGRSVLKIDIPPGESQGILTLTSEVAFPGFHSGLALHRLHRHTPFRLLKREKRGKMA